MSITFIFKISATALFWCVPLLLFPAATLEAFGFPGQTSYQFVRMLGWAYLALCVGYGFGLHASLRGIRAPGPIWVGIVSNAGACAYLIYYGISGSWASSSLLVQAVFWLSALAAGLIAIALVVFGVIAKENRQTV